MTENQPSDKAGNRQAQPAVTIGMPVYNGIEFIDQALGALLDQSYPNFTLLVSDNASTDGTWERLREWAARDQRIVLHRQDSNIGAMGNFRYVLDKAETEYFMWHAYDDWLAPNYVEELVKTITFEDGCALACAEVRNYDAEGSLINRAPAPTLRPGESALNRIKRILRRPQAAWIYGLFRTEDLRRAQALTEEYGYLWTGDFVALLTFILNDRIRGTDRTHFNRRILELSKPRYCPQKLGEQIRFVGRYLRFHFRILRASSLTTTEKLRCLPALFKHASRTRGVLNYKHLVKRPLKRLVRSLASGSRQAIHNR